MKSDPGDEIYGLDPNPPPISRIGTAPQSSPECGRSAENSENDGSPVGISRGTEAWDPKPLVGKLSQRVRFASTHQWRPDGFPSFGDTNTNTGDDSDPTTNPTDRLTTQSAEFTIFFERATSLELATFSLGN